jgi:mannosyltransferase OCH1-like enzyme
MNFPKNIFQTWKTKDVPEQWKKAQLSVIEKNPNWNYTLLTDDDNDKLVKENFPDFYQTFVSLKYPIQRADAVRYCVLYLYGGIYLDLDYICNKSFDDIILNKEVGLIYSNNTSGIFTNSILISKKNSNFWLLTLQQIQKPLPWYEKISKHFEIMNSTGPMMINYVAKNNKNYIETLQGIQTPCSVCNMDTCQVSLKYYVTNIQGQSWNSWDTLVLNFILCNKNVIILIIVLVIFFKLNNTLR